MTPTESIKTCFRKYVDFNGRASRSEFCWFFFFCIVSWLVLSIVSIVHLHTLALLMLYMLALLMPSLAVSVRRLHDTGRSAWWLLLFPILMLGSGVLLVALVVMALLA